MNRKELFEMIEKKILALQQDAIQSEEANRRALGKANVASDIANDKDYWSGYLDALNNVKKEIKRIKRQ